MQKNIGTIDKTIRIIIGIGIIVWGVLAQNMLGIIGIVPLATAFISNCPLYGVCGISTNKNEDKNE
jgi:hypothetical protein